MLFPCSTTRSSPVALFLSAAHQFKLLLHLANVPLRLHRPANDVPQQADAKHEEERCCRIVRVHRRDLGVGEQDSRAQLGGLITQIAPFYVSTPRVQLEHSRLHGPQRHFATPHSQCARRTRLGAAQPMAAERTVMMARADIAPANT